jgi:two-component system response regulator HydG
MLEQPPALREACAVCGLRRELVAGRHPIRIIADSPAMHRVMRRVARVAPTDAAVLLTGESGTGKEVVARAIHDGSQRRGRPFVAVNCAAMPPDLLENELFGHARGAFPGAVVAKRGLFEEADGGTLFLDEVGELPSAVQTKLLRVLQEGEVRRIGENAPQVVDVRVIAATHLELSRLVAEGRFREDLFYRLKIFQLALPPLRERHDDILPLARTLLAREREGLVFTPRAEAAILAYRWPGNVRELANAMRHGAVLAEENEVDVDHLPAEVGAALERPEPGAEPSAPAFGLAGAEALGAGPLPGHHLAGFQPTAPLDDVVRAHVRGALDAMGGNRAAAARALGIGRNTLWRWLKGGRGACNRKRDDEVDPGGLDQD